MKQPFNPIILISALSHLLLHIQLTTANLYLSQNCGKTQFRCTIDGSCIPLTKVQDGFIDCLDGSDEECLPWQFDCQFGSPRCIPQYKVNDGAIDCYTGFDEGCPPHYFVCHDRSACIDFSKYQDGIPHCRDKSDEPCQAGYFLCNDRTKCIEGSKFQDGIEDCNDASDEECTVTQFECPCGAIRCIEAEKMKDGKSDCEDGADETGLTNPRICHDGSLARSSKAQNRTVQLTVHNAIQQCQRPHMCRENLGEICIVISGMPHCVCKKGTVKPNGFPRCVPEQRLQQYLNNIITNCTDIANDLIEVYSPNNEFSIDTAQDERIYEIPCDPNQKYACKGNNEVCVKQSDGQALCVCKDGRARVDGVCLVNECADPSLNDCDPNASCMDSITSYECFCNEGYIDVSSSPTTRPGINCTKLVNECLVPSMHNCDKEAECIDKPIGYTCRCPCGYVDISPNGARNPGRKCKKLINECQMRLADCDPRAICMDLVEGYECRCPVGFTDVSPDPTNRPGRVCAQLINDCSSPGFSGCNPHTSQCVGTHYGFACRCMKGFIDLNPAVPGINCSRPEQNPCLDASLHDCDPVADCFSESPGYFQCQCPKGFSDLSPDKRFPGRKCKKIIDECALGTHECDGNADCMDTLEGYSCRCKPGWIDASPDTLNAPGRVCKKANLCANVKCASEADCHETQLGPVCECASGYIDISRQHGMSSGRVCKKVVNECVEGKHDCSKSASCIDTEDSYTCRCKDGFRDESPGLPSRPGRICVQTLVPQPPECDVKDPLSCDASKKEVCVFVDGTYKCQCATGYGRLPDGRCLVINECQDKRLNDCSENADCIDQAEGYSCRCRSGFVDISRLGQRGRICKQRINECANPKHYHVDCDTHASCIDTDEGYTCRCQPGFADISESINRLPGRRCVEAVNECLDESLNDCSENAICEDAKEGYTCTCRKGYLDASQNTTHYPGRICLKPRENDVNITNASIDSCDPKSPKCRENEVCVDKRQRGVFTCECAENCFRYHDGTCRVSSFCANSNDCDKNAYCINAFDSYKCQCKPGFIDISADLAKRPGRRCKQLINECATGQHNCSPYASCSDASDGYICQCLPGFVDTSSEVQLAPGRRCSNASNECLDRSLHTCDDNADCIDTPDSYICKCYIGYVDVSSGANLPPGRVCTVDTTCPKQKTDLMFLIDGSGSIGSYVFKHEVLRFVREFIELFDIGLDKTRVGLIQYSDQIRHEFDLNQNRDKTSVIQAISQVQYLTGLTRTGAAIQHMVVEGFSERRGARTKNDDVARVAIVITDGRSQDNVTEPSEAARRAHVSIFAVGVTDHVLPSELETISGSASRWFYVDRFKDLDTRLRSLIQKEACPPVQRPPVPPTGCNPQTQTGCNRVLNEICKNVKGINRCVCPEGFHRHSETKVCGGDQCNPDVKTTCPSPEICQKTPFGNYRCSCPAGYSRNPDSGICVLFGDETHPTTVPQDQMTPMPSDCRSGKNKCKENEQCISRYGVYKCECSPGYERHPLTGLCKYPNECSPSEPNTCDARKRERCLLHSSSRYYTCQCAPGEKRDPATEICLRDECTLNIHDCDQNAVCTDTYDGYLCTCNPGYLDQSPNPASKPGRKCVKQHNECVEGTHRCSPNAICTDTPDGYICKCKPGYIDYSSNPQNFGGVVCREIVDECANPSLNTCHPDAICIDTADSYKCVCKNGFVDMDELRNPGRNCQKETTNDKCSPGSNDCDKNARCIPQGKSNYVCACPGGFRDKSPDPSRPGRVCIPLIPECDNPSLNDCDSPDRAICIETDDGYLCRCRQGFYDISPDKSSKPGRLCKELVDECEEGTHDCAPEGGICEDTPDSYTCRCAINFYDVSYDPKSRPGRNCKRLINECETGQNDCSPDAECKDTQDSYICSCKSGYVDVSPDTAHRPGRRCLFRVNECEKNQHDCSVNADCIDTTESYTCKCRDDFVDESPKRQTHPGRVCVPALVDECRLNKHDCHPNAICQDLPQGYSCQCKPEFIDESPNRLSQPGRKCVPRPSAPPAECSINVQTSCKVELNEVCRMIQGVPKCACPGSYSRDPTTNACTVINECQFPQLNDCHPNAECIDQPTSYTCRCRQGFMDISPKDKPGRSCQPLVNECELPHLNDCHQNAVCIDKEDGYECKCQNGFVDRLPDHPGRLCKKLIDECNDPSLNSCDKNAKCFDEEEGYRCECNDNYLDISPSPTMRGRACKLLVNECEDPKLNDCDKNATCTDTTDSYTCECPPNSRDISPNLAFPGRVCMFKKIYCATGQHDCDPHAVCHDNEQSFTCECPQGYVDRSPNKLSRPGRVCVELIDECSTGRHTCSPQAECRDLEEGYTCECKEGYIDRSPNLASQPGRVCGTPEVCPSNHECSSAAVCEPLGGNKYECRCIQGYVDQSPSGQKGRICVRNNACRDPRLNNCSRNAICYDEPSGYRCECARGYIDRSLEGGLPGRICEPPQAPTPPPRHPCQEPELNDCHPAGMCRATGPDTYTCECLRGYEDQSPDKNKPGRNCVLTLPVCLDKEQNDCHSAAICSETDTEEKYTCRCRDGYLDKSPDHKRPGRLCVEEINECLDASLNDCDPQAVCKDLPDGFTCQCPVNAEDRSPDPKKPGRKCFIPVNECKNPALNNCSRFANCIDHPDGYECHCLTGYHDKNPSHPGTVCNFIINECEQPKLNDCHQNADCIDTEAGYDCKCISPYKDEKPELPGRLCTFNECSDSSMNSCDENAECIDLEAGYTCICKAGFYDESPNPSEPGRKCTKYGVTQAAPPTGLPQDVPTCGKYRCNPELNEFCVGGTECLCKPNEGRSSPKDACQPVTRTPLLLRVLHRDDEKLIYTSEIGKSKSVPNIEISKLFSNDMGRSIAGTSYAPRYVSTEVNYVTHPKTVNSSWPDGLLFSFSVATTPTGSPVDKCDLWKQLMQSLQRTNGAIGGGSLRVAPDVELLDPCREVPPPGVKCGSSYCDSELGEVCIADAVCGCPRGEKRTSSNDKCYAVESWAIPVWVIRKGETNLVYNSTFADPTHPINKEYVQRFENGIGQCYSHTPFKDSFVTAEVIEIADPMTVNATWDAGILYNCTLSFRKGSVPVPSEAYRALIRYIIDENNYQIGTSSLYINPYQQSIFDACFKNDCHPKGLCHPLGPNAFRCECGSGYRDLKPNDPGRHCLPSLYNECLNKEDNECSENARCIDQKYLYKCECIKPYVDAAPSGKLPGSVCVLDYCSDVNFCPVNTTCVNLEEQAKCECESGYVDIRDSPVRLQHYKPDVLCILETERNECLLGLTECASVAECIDKPKGYECRCPEGYIDGNPEKPGRFCAAKRCDMCNEHGTCVYSADNTNATCACEAGWSGEFCNIAPSKASMILLIILALLFLLLTLCCLLYFCTKCVCFKGHRRGWPWDTIHSVSSESASTSGHDIYPEFGGIPRVTMKKDAAGRGDLARRMDVSDLENYIDGDYRIPRVAAVDADATSQSSSEYTWREEVVRTVTTDVTKTETHKTITNADVHDTTAEFHVYPPVESAGGADSSSQVAMRKRSASVLHKDEQERGESVAEFSVGNANHEYGETRVEDRRISEYSTDRDLESIASDSVAEDDIYDKTTLVRRNHGYEPDPRTGAERYWTEVTTTTSTKNTSKY